MSNIEKMAAQLHENWRKDFIKANGNVPRVKSCSDGSKCDINQSFEKIHPDWQKENRSAAIAAFDAIKRHPNDLEAASEHVHNEWMKRNPKADYNAHQHVSYKDLPDTGQKGSEWGKDADRAHVKMALSYNGVSEAVTYLAKSLRNRV